jgi:nucleotide-binding universal stress UspA family protein
MSRISVLAATDFSPRSAQVAGRAAALAGVLGARLVLVHVLSRRPEAPAPAVDGSPRVRPLLARLGLVGRTMMPGAAEARLAALAAQLGGAVETQVLTGHPEVEIAVAAAEAGAALVVLGLHRPRRVLDALRLTTMERIVLAAPAPVLIAHQQGARPYRRVLALTDFSDGSAAALAMAARVAPEAEFHAIHALQVPLVAAVASVATGEAGAAAERARSEAEELRRAFLARPGLPALAEPPELVAGGVHEVLEFRRQELGADLLCLGSHSSRRPGELGHYARDLMRAPPADLLVARSD